MAGLAVAPGVPAEANDLLWEDTFDPARLHDRPYGVAAAEGWVVEVGESEAVEGNIDILVRAYDGATGALVWEDRVDPAGGWDTPFSVAIASGRVFVGGNVEDPPGDADWIVRAYALDDGAVLWQDTLDLGGFETVDPLVVRGNRVIATGWGGPGCFSDCDEITRAYDARTGTVVWEDRVDRGTMSNQAIAVATAGAAVLVGGWLGTEDGLTSAFQVRALDAETGLLLWEDQVFGPGYDTSFVTQIATHGDRAYAVGTVDDNWLVRAYHAATGTVLWSRTFSLISPGAGFSDVPFQVATDGERVVVGGYGTTRGRGFYALDWVVNSYDAKTGRLLWSDVLNYGGKGDEAVGGIAIHEGQAFVSGGIMRSTGHLDVLLRVYDLAHGGVLWEDDIQELEFPPGIWYRGLALDDGRVTVVGWSVTGFRDDGGFELDTTLRTYDASAPPEDGGYTLGRSSEGLDACTQHSRFTAAPGTSPTRRSRPMPRE
jgi:hypothetical protein